MSKQLANIYHNLATMSDAGVPVKRALNVAAKGAPSRYLAALDSLCQSVGKGNTLAQTMREYPETFDPIDVMVVDAGETSGELGTCLEQLSEWYLFKNRLKNIILQGMLLPGLVLHFGAILVPAPGYFLGAYSAGQYWLRVIIMLLVFYFPFAAVFLIMKFGRDSRLRKVLDELIIRIPVLGRAILILSISRFTNAFSLLCSAGVPVITAAQKACEIAGNRAVAKMFEGGVASAKSGNEVSAGFSRKLPADYLETWQVGEETGQLDTVTKRLGLQLQQEAEMMFTELAKWMPRVVYCIICIFLIKGIFEGFSMISGRIGNLGQ